MENVGHAWWGDDDNYLFLHWQWIHEDVFSWTHSCVYLPHTRFWNACNTWKSILEVPKYLRGISDTIQENDLKPGSQETVSSIFNIPNGPILCFQLLAKQTVLSDPWSVPSKQKCFAGLQQGPLSQSVSLQESQQPADAWWKSFFWYKYDMKSSSVQRPVREHSSSQDTPLQTWKSLFVNKEIQNRDSSMTMMI